MEALAHVRIREDPRRHLAARPAEAGEHELKLECLGKGDRSSGHFLAVDAFTLKSLSP